MFLTIAHGWHALKARWRWPPDRFGWAGHAAAVLLTFGCVVIALVPFRAPGMEVVLRFFSAMAGMDGAPIDWSFYETAGLHRLIDLLHLTPDTVSLFPLPQAIAIAGLLAMVWILPNTQQWLRHYRNALNAKPVPSWLERWRIMPLAVWRPSLACGIVVGMVSFFALARAWSAAPREFFYFKF